IFRLANARSNFISEATAKVWMIGETVSQEGRRLVGFRPMRLIKSENPTLAASQINFVVVIVGFDETSGQTLHARDVFAAQDVRFGHEYVDFVWVDDEGMRHIDYAKIDATRFAAPSAARAEVEPTSDGVGD